MFMGRVVSRLGFRNYQLRDVFESSPEISTEVGHELVLGSGVVGVVASTRWGRSGSGCGPKASAPCEAAGHAGTGGARCRRRQAVWDAARCAVVIQVELLEMIDQPQRFIDRQQYRWRERFPLGLLPMGHKTQGPNPPSW